MFVANATEFSSPPLSAWLLALRGQLREGGAGAPLEVLGPVSAMQELALVCETMLAGRGGPNEDDRKTVVADVKEMRGALGPKTAAAVGTTLNDFIGDLRAPRLATPQGARSLKLTLEALNERLYRAEACQAAWDDVVDTFRNEEAAADVGEQRIMILRELCEGRGHAWSGVAGLGGRLTRLLSDDIFEAATAGAIEADPAGAPAWAGLPEDARVALCRDLVGQDARRGDVAVWLLFRNAYVESWQRLGPVQLFNAQLTPDGIREGGNLQDIEGYQPPPELADWDMASHHLGDLGVPANEHAVLARVSLADTLIEQAPERARDLVQTLIEVANDDSRWVLQEGEIAYRAGAWYGSLGFDDPAQLEENRRAVNPVFERTREALTQIDGGFVERLAAGDAGAAEAVEDARWVIAVSRAPTAAQRVALGTRALERTLGIAQSQGEGWPQVTTRYLLAPWLRLHRWRWVQAAAVNARLGVAKTHGRGSLLYGWIDELVFPRGRRGLSHPSAEGVALLEAYFGPLDATIARGLIENRLLRMALAVLREPEAALKWLTTGERRFELLLDRTERCRNAVIHGQRLSPGSLATVDEFVRDLGRLVARESMHSAETGDMPLVQLERWRVALVERRARLEARESPMRVLFTD